MRRWFVLFLLSSFAVAQAPQSPRQALIELLRATSPAIVDKHTPDVLLQALSKLPPEQRQKQQQSMMLFSMMMAMSGSAFQTFEAGPTFAIYKSPKDNSKVEITVERDDLAGDIDTMEFGIHISKDGKVQQMPMDPRILIDMKMEKNVWKLSRIGGSASLQLDDPKVAALIVQQARESYIAGVHTPNSTNSSSQLTIIGGTSGSSAVGYLRSLNTAEVTYAATYPEIGYTCRLSDLGGSLNGNSPDAHGAQLINPALESGTRSGYRYEISGCSGKSAYRISATPINKGSGLRIYCTDESATIRSAGEGEDCWATGKPVH